MRYTKWFSQSWPIYALTAPTVHGSQPHHLSLAIRDTAASKPAVNATAKIRDHNNVDITSSFKFMVYHQPANQSTTNNSESSLNDRQMDFSRPVNECPRNESFVESHCTPQGSAAGALQRYTITCRRWIDVISRMTGDVVSGRWLYRVRGGHCLPFEVCTNGFEQGLMASCVQEWVFDEYLVDQDGEVRSMLEGALLNVESAYAVLSKTDGKTPIEADTLDVDAWVDGSIAGNGSVQSKTCRDCVGLGTGKLEPDTDALKVDVKLLTAGAAAGILWLAVMSG